MTRICLDSNVLVAAFVARGLCADLLRRVLSEHELVAPELVAEEVCRTLSEKLKASPEALSTVAAVLERCDIVPRGDAPSPMAVRDPDDERILADAISACAKILVSGDPDLLVGSRRIPDPHPFTQGFHDPRSWRHDLTGA